MLKKSLVTSILLVVFSSSALALEESGKRVIDRLTSYSQFGNGDIFISLGVNGTICSYGYYINKDSAGYESNLSMLLAAYQAQTPVILAGHENNRWLGSANTVCELYSVEYKR